MFIAFILLVAVAGVALAVFTKKKRWAVLGIWLSVPVGIILWGFVGFFVASLGNCHPSAAGGIDCVVFGIDVSNWMNSLHVTGYAFAFYALPWLAIGAACVVIYFIWRAVVTLWK